MLEQLKKEGFTPVVYVSKSLLKSLSTESKEDLLMTVDKLEIKKYSEDTEKHLLLIKKAYVFKYGHLDDCIVRKIVTKGGKVTSGNF